MKINILIYLAKLKQILSFEYSQDLIRTLNNLK